MLRRNVLIFHSGALGDFILTWPIALALSRIFPQSRVMYVTASQKGKLAERVLRVESVDVESGWHWLYSGADWGSAPENVRRLLASTHTALLFCGSEPDPAAVILHSTQPEMKVIAINTKHGSHQHHVESLLAQLDDWTVLQQAAVQLLAGIRERGLAVKRSPDCDLVIHPGSGGESKCWPVSCFVSLAKRVIASGRTVRFIIGEVERERWPADQITALRAAAEVREPATLLALHEELLAARAFLGNDSGPGHLAAICGVPTVSLFGSTDPAIWSPVGPAVRVLQHQPIESLSVDNVAKALPFGQLV